MKAPLNKELIKYLAFLTVCAVCFFPFSLKAASSNYTQQLTADVPQADANFGNDIALSEDGQTMVIGAPGDNTFGADAGAVFIFELQNGTWVQVDKIFANEPDPSDFFGTAVAIYGDRLVVGATGDDEGAPGAGAAYIFEKGVSAWSQTDKLLSSSPQDSGLFGRRVQISSIDRIFVASDEDNGEGAVAIYEPIKDIWQETDRLKANDADAGDDFGSGLAHDPDNPNRLVVGADAGNRDSDNTGAVYIFDFISSSWEETDKLTASDADPGDNFGVSVDLCGDTLVVGADQDSELGLFAGAAYVFEDQGGTWKEIDKLTAQGGMAFEGFGFSVGISGSRILIGTFANNEAFVFEDVAGTWTQTKKIENIPNTSHLGQQVAIKGSTLVIGDCQAVVNSMIRAGLVYVKATAPEVTVVTTATETTITLSDCDGTGDLAQVQVKLNGLDITGGFLDCLILGICPITVQVNAFVITVPLDLTSFTIEVTLTDQQGYQGQGSN